MKLVLPDKRIPETKPSLITALDINPLKTTIISVVGAGGKTSTILRLANEYENRNKNVVITTTTHMFQPKTNSWCQEESYELLEGYIKKNTVVWLGIPSGEEKIKSPSKDFLETLKQKQISMLIEADGSKRKPFKVPGEKEPVILEGSHIVMAVLGMDALGKPINEVCHRPNMVAEYLKKSAEEKITIEDYVTVLKSETGLKKGVAKSMKYVVILNKIDDKQRENEAVKIRDNLKKMGIKEVYLTSYPT